MTNDVTNSLGYLPLSDYAGLLNDLFSSSNGKQNEAAVLNPLSVCSTQRLTVLRQFVQALLNTERSSRMAGESDAVACEVVSDTNGGTSPSGNLPF